MIKLVRSLIPAGLSGRKRVGYSHAKSRAAALALGLMGCASTAPGQSFNIDFEAVGAPASFGGGVPSSAFGAAANQPGVWNLLSVGSPTIPLVNLSGAGTSASISFSPVLAGTGLLNPNATGDFARLMNDYANFSSSSAGGSATVVVSGLTPGQYAVYTYGGTPNPVEMFVGIASSNQGTLPISGSMSGVNTFIPGVTHVVHTLNVTTGTFSIQLTDLPNAPFAGVNGFQIVLLPSQAIVDCITYTSPHPRILDVTIAVVDENDNPLAGASVTINLTGSNGVNITATGVTGANGTVLFTRRFTAACYTTNVTSIVLSGHTFDGTEPLNGYQKGFDTTPDADCRSASDLCGSG